MKWPVLSRLTLAWLSFAALGSVAFGYALGDFGRPEGFAMRIEGVERLAAPARTVFASPERLAPAKGVIAPTLAAASNEPFSLETQDGLPEFGGDAAPSGSAGEIVITIDGAPAPPIRGDARAPARQPFPVPGPVAAIDPALLKKTVYGAVPQIAGGRTAAETYAKPFAGDGPLVALIVGGLGLNRALTERAIEELPANVTLAFAPYARDLPELTKRAREFGHEILIEIPMEHRRSDPAALGPAAMLTTRSPEDNLRRLDWILSRFGGYFGVANYQGSKFTADDKAFDPVLARIREAGLAYIDDTGAAGPGVVEVDRLIRAGYESDRSEALRDLKALEKSAERNGGALGKTYAHAAGLDIIAEWAEGLKERGATLAPASAIVAMRDERSVD